LNATLDNMVASRDCGTQTRSLFDKLHVVWHASTAVDKMRRTEQRSDRSVKGMRWSPLEDRSRLSPRPSRCSYRQDDHRAYRPRL